MGLPDILGYKAFWHPYKGRNLPFRLLYPYNYNPANSYPLIIYGHGSGDVGDDNVLHLCYYSSIAGVTPRTTNPNETFSTHSQGFINTSTTAYQTWPCFVLCPQAPDGALYQADGFEPPTEQELYGLDTWHMAFYKGTWRYVANDSWFINGVEDIVRRLIAGTFTFYDDSGCTNIVNPTTVNLNSNKIYMFGFSLGSIVAESLLKNMRDVLAGVIHSATVVGGSANFIAGTLTTERLLRISREIERYYHIPLLILVGSDDHYFLSSTKFTDTYLAKVQEKGWTNNLYYVTMPGYEHQMEVMSSVVYATNKFDDSVHTEQHYGVSGVNPLDWLFSKSKPVTPTDPYPLEESTYYPERSCLLYTQPYTGQRVVTDIDTTKEMITVKLSESYITELMEITSIEFTNNRFTQDGYFKLWNRNDMVDKLSTRQSNVFV